MGPIEILYVAIGVTVLLIGLARGYVKELGNTIILMSAVFIISFVYARGGERLASLATTVITPISGDQTAQNVAVLLSTFWTVLFIAIVFASYAGVTLEISGKRAGPPLGNILDVLIGTLNGYLVAGTLWFIQDVYGYPIQYLVTEFDPTLTPRAARLVDLLPPTVFPNPVYWVIPVVILLIWAVRK